MSLFGGLTSTSATKKCPTRNVVLDFGDLPHFSFAELVNKDEMGRFASVFTAEFPSSGEKVAVKKFLGVEEDNRKILLKEAKLLNSLKHPNIVGFIGVCNDTYALLLEYVYFDFTPFGHDLQVNSLADLLCHFDKTDAANIDKNMFFHVAEDVARGLKYLHDKGFVCRSVTDKNISNV